MTDAGFGALPVERAEVRDGLELAYVRAGEGGRPLLLVHGWPETRRIWARNAGPLADAGFEVIVPDRRGFGDSGLAPDERYDTVASSLDLHALVTEVLGHERCAACGGDFGGATVQDMGPALPGADRAPVPVQHHRACARALGAAARGAPGGRLLRAPGPRRRHARGRAAHARGAPPPRLFERSPIPTLVLYGPEDHVISRDFVQLMERAFDEPIGPFVVAGAGHFLQWERAGLLNRALIHFLLR